MSDFDTPLTRAHRAHLDAIRDDLASWADTVPNPPTREQITDLWAHARQHTDDGEQAARWVRQTLALGWRPMGDKS